MLRIFHLKGAVTAWYAYSITKFITELATYYAGKAACTYISVDLEESYRILLNSLKHGRDVAVLSVHCSNLCKRERRGLCVYCKFPFESLLSNN